MSAKCGSCYWNVNIPGCTWDRMQREGDGCQEYELEKKLEGRPKKEKSTSGKLPQSDGVTGETAERLAKEHRRPKGSRGGA